MNTRLLPDPVRYAGLNTRELREAFLIDDLFQTDRASFTYIDLDRTVVGGVLPVKTAVDLPTPELLRADFFCQRRELGMMNVGGPGTVTVEGTATAMAFRDALYVGRGVESVRFASDSADNPAAFYLISYPAHADYPVSHARVDQADPMHLGSGETANERTIYKYIYLDGIQSSQLVMGFTEMHPGSIWNTMPAHKHMRRSEVYLYFGLPDDAAVVHLMGMPEETRHLMVRNRQAVISPGWSIHAGAGTSNYGFIWAMGGENQDYTDMDPVAIRELL